MAREVLGAAMIWLTEHILLPLQSDAAPEERVRIMVRRLKEFYAGGKQACLLNLLSSPQINRGPFAKEIKSTFKAFIASLKGVLVDFGLNEELASGRAERAVILIQGSLVLSRGLGTTRPFRECLDRMPDELFGVAKRI